MTTLPSNLSPALALFEAQLQLFVESSDFYTKMALAFGESHDYSAFKQILLGGGYKCTITN